MENRVLKLGLGLGAALLFGGSSSSRSKRSQYVRYPSFTDSPNTPSFGLSAKSAKIVCIVLMIFAPVFQALGYISYTYWDFWTFFSLLVFSTLALICIGFALTIADDTLALGKSKRRRLFIAILVDAFVTLCLSLWPLFVKDSKRTYLSYALLSLEIILMIVCSISICYESSVHFKKEKETFISVQPEYKDDSRV